MKVIYYNVSGEIMELLQFIINNFFGGKLGELTPLIELLKKNDFDIKKIISELKPETLAPLVSAFTEFFANTNSPTDSAGEYHGISPIAKIADKEIVYTLNKYFA